jgi:solute carrier family 38 (sodium-coupled neutral amino acid transporter), member 11
MAKDGAPAQDESLDDAESQRLLSMTTDDVEPHSKPKRPSLSQISDAPQRQSSFAHSRRAGAPRTPNRVRFDLDEIQMPSQQSNGTASHPAWMDEEDYMDVDESTPTSGREIQRVPLLSEIEAPSVRVAIDFDPEDHLEDARPRSNMRSAFMNMANSIM